uniref:Uncharacterized protein n=1 Tax=Pithovirus LCPAC406 TaxID=2506599 RepID=A0A481ZDL4_9VIRU|nr:MAG: hypothetical protein LCPAC406_01910 [Pithovirus LCPAC406]
MESYQSPDFERRWEITQEQLDLVYPDQQPMSWRTLIPYEFGVQIL